jgi:hypothetical protein
VVTSNALQRTFRIEVAGKTGTAFLIDVDKRRYLVTASHLFPESWNSREIYVRNGDDWLALPCELLGEMADPLDVAVLVPEIFFGPRNELPIVLGGGASVGFEYYFLGFPWGLATQAGSLNANYPIPLVKRAVCSAFQVGSDGKPSGYYLDGINNPGFSGGPLLEALKECPRVFGVITGYRSERTEIFDQTGRPTGLFYEQNSGIVTATDIRFPLEIIHATPRGLALE